MNGLAREMLLQCSACRFECLMNCFAFPFSSLFPPWHYYGTVTNIFSQIFRNPLYAGSCQWNAWQLTLYPINAGTKWLPE